MKQTADDFAQRFTAFHGGKPPSQKVALKGLAAVHDSLIRRFREHVARQKEAAEQLQSVLGPISELIAGDKRVADGLRAFRKMSASLGKRRIAPPTSFSPKIASRITSGSILTFGSAPYDYEWDKFATGGAGSAQAEARKSNGTAFVHATGNHDGSAAAFGGVGRYFRPISENAFVRFSPYVKYNYSWNDVSRYLTAHSRGFVGVMIHSLDLNLGDFRVEVDIRPYLWSDGTSWFEFHDDFQEGVVWAYTDTVYFPATSNRHYFAWVWCSVSCDDNTNSLGESSAEAILGMSVPFMVFEQYT